MKEIDQELLSRILDEDVSEFETQRILKEMSTSAEHRDTLQRYSLIGHAIRKELPTEFNTKFADQVMTKLEGEVQDSITADEFSSSNLNSSSKVKTMVGLAIAASVAIFSFVTLQDFLQPGIDSEQTPVPAPVVAERVIEESDIQRVSIEELQNFTTNPEAAAEFNSYIVNHAEYASPRASMPHVRIVGYDQER